MIDLKNRRINELTGNVILNDNSILELMYQGKEAIGLIAEDSEEINLFNKNARIFDKDECLISTKDNSNIDTSWNIPEKYKSLDLMNFLLSKCSSETEKKRVEYEYKKYEEFNLIDMLKFFVYLVDVMREHEILWGVGRGSSVSSYILYLIGIHRINSIKYDLNFDDFIK